MNFDKFLAKILLALVRFYRYVISPLLPARCRFYPTCSSYALEALQLHGGWRGGWLAVRRICRCHPFGGSGVDFVPLPWYRYDYVYVASLPVGYGVFAVRR
ncbi:membrane protein insertion efficiency factor YidD [Faucicola mancuniensis]|uniref:membrane protein insertion efficiency factor YidD n=1 Tax=Faucicola mancuniensis TaxID=1309795 RepID=UPI0028F08EEA|nr:membrane protein insertion efficiency factor YidD [uncultured Moraxella sp.]